MCAKKKSETHYIQVLAKSKFFDSEWYAETYRDKMKDESDPATHYLRFGRNGETNPSPLFDSAAYLNANPDVLASDLNPLVHYELFGLSEGRAIQKLSASLQPTPEEEITWRFTRDLRTIAKTRLFDRAWYVEIYPESVQDGSTPEIHYLKHGASGTYHPGPDFDSKFYLEAHKDVKLAGMNPLVHYERFGAQEGRETKALPVESFEDVAKRVRRYTRAALRGSPLFEAEWYIEQYLQGAPLDLEPTIHYVQFGAGKGYDPSPLFSTKNYFEAHPEIRGAGLNPLAYYILHGASIGHDPHPQFREAWYRAHVNLSETDSATGLEDYIKSPDRSQAGPSPSFDAAWFSRSAAMDPSRHKTPLHALMDVKARRLHRLTQEGLLRHGIQEPSTIEQFMEDGLVFEFDALPDHLCKSLVDFATRKRPLVSVVMPTFNRIRQIDKAIASVLAQSYQEIELVIVDDGSSDGTSEHVAMRYGREIAAGRIVLSTQTNCGVCRARNVGLARARGEIIAYLDSDNAWRPQAVALMVSALLRNPSAGAVYCAAKSRMTGTENTTVVGGPYDRTTLLRANYIDLNTYAHRRDLLKTHGGFDERLRRLVDWDLILRQTADRDVVFVPVIMVDYFLGEELANISLVEPLARNSEHILHSHRREMYRAGIRSAQALALSYVSDTTPDIASSGDTTFPIPAIRPPHCEVRVGLVVDADSLAAFSRPDLAKEYWFVETFLVKDGAVLRAWDPQADRVSGPVINVAELEQTVLYWPTVPGRMLSPHDLHLAVIALALGNLDIAVLSRGRAAEKAPAEVSITSIRDQIVVSAPQIRHWLGRMEFGACLRGAIIEVGDPVTSAGLPLSKISSALRLSLDVDKDRMFWSRDSNAIAVESVRFDHATVPLPKTKKSTVVLIGMKTGVGGVERLTSSLGHAWRDKYHCIYLALETTLPEQGDLTDQIREGGMTLLDGSKMPSRIRIELLKQIAERYAPEAVFIMNGSKWLVDSAEALRTIFADSVIVDQQVYDHESGWIQHTHKPSIQSFDHFVAVNRDIERVFIDRIGIESARISYIPHGIDVSKGVHALETLSVAEARAEFGLPSEGRIVMFAGRLTEQKRPLDFLAVAETRRHRTGETYVLLGDGVLRDACIKKIKESGLDNVIHIPFASEINRIYRAIDLLMVTSEYEGLPLVLIEAICMGIPVLSTDVGAVRETLSQFEAGRGDIVPGDVGALSEAVESLLDGPIPFRPTRALEVRDHFGLERMAERYEKAAGLKGKTQ